MDQAEQIRIAKRLLGFIQNGTAETAPHPLAVDVARYTDPALWQREVDAFYKRLPVVAGLSCELAGPGAYLAQDIAGVPVLLLRDAQGTANAFLNVCRHRGAPVASGCGQASRFACPYHAWTYDQSGRLVGVNAEATFGPIDKAAHGLTRLPCAERGGLIWIGLTPGMAFDIDCFLAGVDRHMAAAGPMPQFIAGERSIAAPNWKITLEGHLESYHFATIHRNSIGPNTYNNVGAIDRFGPHILITVAHRHITDLLDRPESEWQPLRDGMMTAQYVLFPGASISFVGEVMIAQTIRPGPDVGQSVNRMTMAFREPARDAAHAAEQSAFLDMIGAVLADEDYACGFAIQKGLKSGAQDQFRFGLNEPGIVYFHEVMRDWLAADAARAA